MLTALCLALAFAQEPAPSDPQEGTQVQTRSIESAEEGDAMVYRITELHLTSPGLEVRADRVTIWFDGAAYRQLLGIESAETDIENGTAPLLDEAEVVLQEGPPSPVFRGLWSRRVLTALGLPEDDQLIREIRLDGHVEIFGQEMELRCERLQDWPAEGRSLGTDVVLDLPPGMGGPNGWPLRVTATEVSENPDGSLTALNAAISTCLDRPPHYNVFFEELIAEPDEDGEFIWHPSGGWLELGGLPLIPVPTPDFSAGSNFLGFRGIVFRSSRRLGNAITPRFGGRQSWDEGKSMLDWVFEPTYSTDRGWPLELRFTASTPNYQGQLDLFHLNDEGPDRHSLRRSLARGDDSRDRLRWYNRWLLDEQWWLDANIALTSDALVDPEFFQKDWVDNDNAESELYLRRRGLDTFFDAAAVYRLDDVGFTPIEGFGKPPGPAPQSLDVLPALSFDAFSSTFADLPTGDLGNADGSSPLNFSWGAEVGQFRLRDRNLIASRGRTFTGLPSISRTRGRFWTEAAVPVDVGGFFLRPGVRLTGSLWEDSTALAEQDEQLHTETFLETGVVMEKRFVDGWRHRVLPQLRLRSRIANREASGPLIDFDGHDLLSDGEVLEFSLRQFFYAPNSTSPWLDVNLLMPWYSDGTDLLDSPIAPFPRGPREAGVGPAELRVTWTPGSYTESLEGIRWDARVRHDFDRAETEEIFTRILVRPDSSLYYGADYYEVNRTSNDVAIGSLFGGVRFSEEWAVGFRQSENFDGEAGLRSAWAAQHYGHDFLFEFGYQRSQATGESGIYFNISPRFFSDNYGSRDLAKLRFQ